MSRIGRQPIPIPAGVQITIEPELVTVKGPKGELSERVSRDIMVEPRRVRTPTVSSWSSRGRPIAASTARCTA